MSLQCGDVFNQQLRGGTGQARVHKKKDTYGKHRTGR
jgi:hypothetical protein